MTLRILVAFIAAVAIFASACGGDSGAAPPTTTVNAGQEADASDEATDGTSGEGDIEREGSSGGGDIEVPDVVGLDHQLAQDTMQGAGLSNLAEEDATGQGRLLLWDRNWTVVEQEPDAGILVNEDRAIILRSKKDAE
jgi:beta-lactam-binding protein with PASTA domain